MSQLSIKVKSSPALLYGLALAIIFGIALFIRVYFPYDNVFTGDWVRFKYFDPWYHMRLVENLVHHFPYRISFDPFTYYPHGQAVYFAPFPDLLLGFFIWIIGLGSPSQKVIETAGVYFPAILGALVTIPVYFTGKALFNRTVGIIAAALVMILPGQFLLRSLLGFTDHHVAETLFSTMTMLFLILAMKSAHQKELSFSSLRNRNWIIIRKPLLYSFLAGLSLGFYLLSWIGGALVVLIILFFAFIQFILDHLQGKSNDYLCIIGTFSFLIALLMVIPALSQIADGDRHIFSLLLGIIAFIVMSGISLIMTKRKMNRFYYLAVLVGLGGIGFAIFYLVEPSLLKSILHIFEIITPSGVVRTISEATPLTLRLAWSEFTTAFYLSLISFIVVLYIVIKERTADKSLLLIWSVIMLVATLGQNRFSYYFTVNAALLTSYLCWFVANWGYSKLAFAKVREQSVKEDRGKSKDRGKARQTKKAKRKKAKERRRGLGTSITGYPGARYIYLVLATIVIFFLAFYPNIGKAIDVASQTSEPNQDWYDALVWMRDNTPDPFQNTDFYYDTYKKPPGEEDYDYPESAYGVMNWWDYGHWITYIAHRIPHSNPHQAGAYTAGRFFTEYDLAKANEMLNRLDTRYIIIDYPMSLNALTDEGRIFGKFYAMIGWSGRDENDFYGTYYRETEPNKLERVIVYYPEYYQSMCVRLYLFGGEEVIPSYDTRVISYAEITDKSGFKLKKIVTEKEFATYEAAKSYLDSQTEPNYRLVGVNPFISPVPLEKLENYKQVYQSPPRLPTWGDNTISYVKIFEYSP